MIVEWFYSLGAGLMTWLVSQFPAYAVPEWFTGMSTGVTDLIDSLSGVGGWVDFPVVTTVVSGVVGVWLVCFIIKLFLRVGSHVPGVGGAG